MTVFYSTELAGIASTPVVKASAISAYGSRLKRFRATITLNTQTTSDTIVVGQIPAGLSFAYGVINTDTSLGSSTVAIGVTGTTGKYRTAATFTSTNTPTFFGNVAGVNAAALSAEETVFITIAAANFPASGNLVVDLYYSSPN